jgi:hypothetical protein
VTRQAGLEKAKDKQVSQETGDKNSRYTYEAILNQLQLEKKKGKGDSIFAYTFWKVFTQTLRDEE